MCERGNSCYSDTPETAAVAEAKVFLNFILKSSTILVHLGVQIDRNNSSASPHNWRHSSCIMVSRNVF